MQSGLAVLEGWYIHGPCRLEAMTSE